MGSIVEITPARPHFTWARPRARASWPTAGMTRERVRDDGWDWGDVLKNADSRDARRRRDARGDRGMDGARWRVRVDSRVLY